MLLPYASELEAADARLRPVLTPAVLERIVGQLPEAWLVTGTPFATAEEHRAAYRDYLGAPARGRAPLRRGGTPCPRRTRLTTR